MEVSEKVADMKGIPTEKDLVTLLQENVAVVTFNKINGDKRIMTCTKSFAVIPEKSQPKTENKPKEGVVTVWDTTAEAWRSFRYDRVLNVELANKE
jgi:hypothetical protein